MTYKAKYQAELTKLENAKIAVIGARNELKNAMANDLDALEQAGDIDGLKELRGILPIEETKIVTPIIRRLGGGIGKERK